MAYWLKIYSGLIGLGGVYRIMTPVAVRLIYIGISSGKIIFLRGLSKLILMISNLIKLTTTVRRSNLMKKAKSQFKLKVGINKE